MIKLIMSQEFILDIFTPGITNGPIECTEGLPPNVVLTETSLDEAGNAVFMFDDGNDEIIPARISFKRPANN